jgi:hypothetical protein
MPYSMTEQVPVAAQSESEFSQAQARQCDVARRMQQRLMAHVIGRSTDRETGPMFNDPAVYTDPARFETEKSKIFRALPLLAGLAGRSL